MVPITRFGPRQSTRSRWARNGSEFCISGPAAQRDPPGGGVEVCPIPGHTARDVWAPEYPPGYCSGQPETGLGRPEGTRNALNWPEIAQNGSGPVRSWSRAGGGAPVPHPTTANRHQPPADNHQLPTAAERHPPSIQARGAQKRSNGQWILKGGPRPLGRVKPCVGHYGPRLTRFVLLLPRVKP